MKNKVCVGLIGLGYWGINYLRVMLQLADIKLKYICDKVVNKFRYYAGLFNVSTVNFTNNITDLAEDKELEAVIIAAPASTHYEIAKVMLKAGKHVLVEKPLTMNYKQALEPCHLSKKVNKILMVGHIYCYNPAVNYIKEVIRTGKLGHLYYGIGLRLGLGPIRSDASCTWDLATHDIAMLDYILDRMPNHVNAHATLFLQREKGIYDYAVIQLKYGNFHFTLLVSWYAAEKIRMWYLMGSEGMLKFNDVDKNAPISIFDKSVTINFSEQHVTEDIFKIIPREGATIIPYIKKDEPLLLETKHFIESIRTGKKPITNCEQGIRVIKVLEAIERSIKNGGKTIVVN